MLAAASTLQASASSAARSRPPSSSSFQKLLAVSGTRLIWHERTSGLGLPRNDIVDTNVAGTDPHLLGTLPPAHASDLVDVAVTGNSVFWARLRHHQIFRANLDGSNVKVFADTGSYEPFRLEFGAGRVFWLAQSRPSTTP